MVLVVFFLFEAGCRRKQEEWKASTCAKCLGLTSVVRFLLWEDVPLGLTYYFLAL